MRARLILTQIAESQLAADFIRESSLATGLIRAPSIELALPQLFDRLSALGRLGELDAGLLEIVPGGRQLRHQFRDLPLNRDHEPPMCREKSHIQRAHQMPANIVLTGHDRFVGDADGLLRRVDRRRALGERPLALLLLAPSLFEQRFEFEDKSSHSFHRQADLRMFCPFAGLAICALIDFSI